MALPETTAVEASTSAERITLRAVVLGLGVCALVSGWITYARTERHGGT